MWFNYFKVMIKVMTPEDEQANLILSQYRKGSQQAHAFTREFKSSLQTQKSVLKKIIPELGEDPLKKLRDIQEILDDPLGENRVKVEPPEEANKIKSGSRIMLDVTRERRDLIRIKYNKRISEEQYFKL